MSTRVWVLDLRVSLELAKSFGQRLSAALPLQGLVLGLAELRTRSSLHGLQRN